MTTTEKEIKNCIYCEASPAVANSDYCLHSGAEDGNWRVQCVCGNEALWDSHGQQLVPDCPKCDTGSDKYIVTHFDSAWVINHILKRPDLHKERTQIPASFVATLLQYIESNEDKLIVEGINEAMKDIKEGRTCPIETLWDEIDAEDSEVK